MPGAPLLRQVALMTSDLGRTCAELERELGLTDPYADPGLVEFGLHNALYAVGTGFVEVCSPLHPGSAGQRHLARYGDSGYMLIFQVPDLDAAERRVQQVPARVVWRGKGDGIRAIHLHPKDVPGVIASLDEADPAYAWPWAGPTWTRGTGASVPGRLGGATVAVTGLAAASTAWSAVLGADPAPGEPGERTGPGESCVPLAVSRVRLREEAVAGLREVELALPATTRRGRAHVDVCGVRFVLEDLETAAS